ncbi:MAG TPA: hypothetical protein VF616_00615 [Duganella sp.]|uniref:hypothetical protein n=1 Tax=Duganella sp. TaxID=1904440 RepID=UPI002ECFBA5F
MFMALGGRAPLSGSMPPRAGLAPRMAVTRLARPVPGFSHNLSMRFSTFFKVSGMFTDWMQAVGALLSSIPISEHNRERRGQTSLPRPP